MTLTSNITPIQDAYTTGDSHSFYSITDILREHAKNGTTILINEEYIEGRTNQRMERLLHTFKTLQDLDNWLIQSFPGIQLKQL